MNVAQFMKVNDTDNLAKLRSDIDALDNELLQLVKRRLEIMKKIGDFKKSGGFEIRDFPREKTVVEALEKKADEQNIPKTIIKKIWHIFFSFSEEIEQ